MRSCAMRGSIVPGLLAGLFLAALAAGGYAWWERSTRLRETDNAYVNADIALISSRVAGRVVSVRVEENQFVKKDELLFEVDPAAYRVAVDKARAAVELARRVTVQDSAEVRALEAALTRTATDLGNAETALARSRSLVAKGFLSQQAADDAAARTGVAAAAVEQAHARLEKARAATALARDGQPPAVAAALADLEKAQLDLAHTRTTAPYDGWIVNKRLSLGTLVAPGQQVFGVIRNRSFWVDANFKETELPGIRPGLPVEIEVDMYPGRVFAGTVHSLGGGTGAAFSLLPAQNATGNWVKVTQRIPVKVRFDAFDPQYPLRVGATASVRVQLR